jgi:hypothetical protein
MACQEAQHLYIPQLISRSSASVRGRCPPDCSTFRAAHMYYAQPRNAHTGGAAKNIIAHRLWRVASQHCGRVPHKSLSAPQSSSSGCLISSWYFFVFFLSSSVHLLHTPGQLKLFPNNSHHLPQQGSQSSPSSPRATHAVVYFGGAAGCQDRLCICSKQAHRCTTLTDDMY